MTPNVRVYYTDAMVRTFSSAVVRADVDGAQTRVVLESTAFYPTSGGQPFDTGTLGGAAVLDVVDDETLGVVHVLDRSLSVGQVVEGVINWARRFDHMQQHTGQHVLSAAFERMCHVRTESFHLGTTTCTIDLAREVSADEIAAAEQAANAVVWEDRPVTVRFADAAEAATLPLRKESLRPGVLRLVEVDDYDLSACGGTHVPRTGMIGLIAIAGWERFKGGSRIEFVCGGRALTSHRRLRDTVTALVKTLTVAPHELPAAVERLQADGRLAKKTIRALQEQVAGQLATSLVASAEDVGTFRRVLVSQPGWDASALTLLASAIVAYPGTVAVVIGHGTPAPIVVARSADVVFDAGAFIKAMTAAVGGRGGGRSELAQGAAADAEQMMAFARDSVC
ncbi:MAG: DHHA1 domain-containing protein [Acidobacteria bacterium]|nr:DHHA1 domain-containing protein [Acidobacteriota bacterium]